MFNRSLLTIAALLSSVSLTACSTVEKQEFTSITPFLPESMPVQLTVKIDSINVITPVARPSANRPMVFSSNEQILQPVPGEELAMPLEYGIDLELFYYGSSKYHISYTIVSGPNMEQIKSNDLTNLRSRKISGSSNFVFEGEPLCFLTDVIKDKDLAVTGSSEICISKS